MLEGAQYEIKDAEGLLYDTMTTDHDGYACSIDLPVGTYYVKEIVPPAGFILSDEVIEVEITTDNKATIVFERTNDQTHVVLKKTDLTTGKPVYEAVIKITNSKGEVVFEDTTDLNGEIILYELPADTYTFQETVAAKGFTLNPETFTFTVDYYGHRNRNHLLILKEIEVGDEIDVITPDGKVYTYIVDKTEILETNEEMHIPTTKGKHLILMTCYPFHYTGHAPKKFIVACTMR